MEGIEDSPDLVDLLAAATDETKFEKYASLFA